MEKPLSPAQSGALLDILSHYNTYAEIRDFRIPGSLSHYGPPFSAEASTPSTTPALQGLVSKFILKLPGLRDVPEDFWKVHVQDIIQELELANLSESYDKGIIGTRRTVATAISALIEYPVRGTVGGFSKVRDADHQYDLSKAEDLSRSFRNLMDEVIYGDILERLVEKTAETDRLAEHEPLIQATHEFLLVNIASFMHYFLILSPKGQYLLKLVANANRLVPYLVIRQTLKIGNVASMINAMMKVVLAKMSVTSVTNWIGLTKGEDDGMNLMQQIISTVLHWDNRDFDSRASKIENGKSLSKEQLQCLRDYVTKSREEQEAIRQYSEQSSTSIVVSILSSSSLPVDLSEPAHNQALQYLSCHLSLRDRKEIIRVLCHSKPDRVTTAVRTGVSAYEPVIRNIHKAVDLSDTVSDFEAFLKDTLKMARIQAPGKGGEAVIPTVGDFVQLLKKHQYSCHKFLHQCCKNGKELVEWYLEWAKEAASEFRRDAPSSDSKIKDAGDLTEPLNDLFTKLSKEQQETILPILDRQIEYLDEMHLSSQRRLDAVLRSPASKNPAIAKVLALASSSNHSTRNSSPVRGAGSSASSSAEDPPLAISLPLLPSTDAGPGGYLARWQSLLDHTPITPILTTGTMNNGKTAVEADSSKYVVVPNNDRGPDPGPVIEAMGKNFRDLLGETGVYW